jgi:hypothetical protein
MGSISCQFLSSFLPLYFYSSNGKESCWAEGLKNDIYVNSRATSVMCVAITHSGKFPSNYSENVINGLPINKTIE